MRASRCATYCYEELERPGRVHVHVGGPSGAGHAARRATRSTRSWLASESLRAFSAQRQRTAELSTALKLALRLETL